MSTDPSSLSTGSIGSAPRDFCQFVDIMPPYGGYVLVMIEAYFDESGTNPADPIMCVGGYLFESDRCRAFDAAWRQMLTDFDISHFHMAAVGGGDPPMDKLPSELRHALVRRAIGIIKETMTYAVVVAVHPKQYDLLIPEHPIIGNAYSFIAAQNLMAVAVWADREHYDGPISYFFESGHQHQGEADVIMHAISGDDWIVKNWRYKGHGFLKKKDAPALQAADLLAWHYCDDWIRQSRGEYSRPSYASLIDDRYWHFRWSKRMLQEEAGKIRKWSALYPGRELPPPGMVGSWAE